MTEPRRPAALTLAFSVALALLLLGLGEVAARVAYGLRDRVRTQSGWLPPKAAFQLQSFEITDPGVPGLWRLRAGTTLTLGEALELNRSQGRSIGYRNLVDGARVLGVSEDEVIFRVNQAGYKGPELDSDDSRRRILAVGDSCTFGTMFDDYSYPRALERELARLGVASEVVNAGVGGYQPVHALARIEEFKALGAELAVVYIGWNALFSERHPLGAPSFKLELWRVGHTLWNLVARIGRDRRALTQLELDKPLHPDPEAPEIRRLEGYEPSFLPDVERIAAELEASGSRIVVATLPGLFRSDLVPNARALEVGHLPSYTDNPFVFAKISDSYNEALRVFAREKGYELVDLDAWSRGALVPREEFFTDSVHLTPLGQQMLGEYIAQQLAPSLKEVGAARPRVGAN